MTRLRHLLLAATIASLAVSGNAATVKGDGGMKVGDSEFIYRQTVKKDNLWTISLGLMSATGNVTQNQMMAAILHRNPDAFDQGSMFYLRQGVVLTVPSLQEIRAEDIAKSDALFSHQHQAWSEGRPLLPDQHSTSEVATGKSVGSHDTPVSRSDVIAAPKIQAKLDTQKATKETLDQDDALKRQSGSQGSNLVYGFGLAAILAGLFFFFYLRRENPSEGNLSDSPSSASTPPSPGVKRSKPSKETSHAPEGIVVTQQVVVNDSLDLANAERPKAGDEAGLKLDIAKAYLELKRDDDARALLEEVTVEGGAGTRNKAKKLLGR